MLSKTMKIRATFAPGFVAAGILLAAIGLAVPANAQVTIGLTNIGQPNAVCINSDSAGSLGVSTEQDCDAEFTAAPYLQIGPNGGDNVNFNATTGTATFNATANFNDSTNFNSNNVQFNSANVAFGNSTVVFNGGSVTFNNSITTNGISNTGNISTSGILSGGSATITGLLSAGSVAVSGGVSADGVSVTGNLTALGGANVNMGNNQVHGVAAGTANTDAVNVGQLNAVTGNVTALQTTVATHTTQIGTLNTAVATQATQITALQTTDLAFDSRIDTLELLAEDLDERIGDVDDRASAGTAAAVALSGAMFLPGKSFNLTGNVGSYRGAHAAALQFGALVSDRVALNAGIAHGFNKGGKTALRAGFTIGW